MACYKSIKFTRELRVWIGHSGGRRKLVICARSHVWKMTLLLRTLAKNILHLIEEIRRALDRLVFYFHCLPKLLEQSPLLARHLGRNLHANAYVQITASAVRVRQALRFFAEDLTGLRSLRYLEVLFSRKRGDFNRGAQRRLRQADWNRAVEVGTPALKESMVFHFEKNIKIAGLSTVCTGLAVPSHSQSSA